MVGSTHKSLYGPQGGLVLVYNEELTEKVRFNTTWRTLDNPHLNRIAALGQALYEIKRDEDYGKKVVESAKALARALDERNIPVRYAPRYTESHQILLDAEKLRENWALNFNDFSTLLERNNIITDSVGRLGVAEAVHIGMRKEDMGVIADFVGRAMKGEDIYEEVIEFVGRFRGS
jgi:glycine hydroxymethyltransferase